MRILQLDGQRVAIRLEDIYWTQLREFAAEDGFKFSKLVFEVCATMPEGANRTAHLRCYCLDRMRRQAGQYRLSQLNFDMLAIIAACPAPVVVITPTRKIVAFNPAFSTDVLKHEDSKTREARQPVNLTFSEPIRMIQKRLIDHPRHIAVYQVGVIAGAKTSHHHARFALLDRALGTDSHMIMYLNR